MKKISKLSLEKFPKKIFHIFFVFDSILNMKSSAKNLDYKFFSPTNLCILSLSLSLSLSLTLSLSLVVPLF